MESVMNGRRIIHLLIAVASILTVVIAESFIDPNIASAQSCEVRSVFGGRRCSVTCPAGTYPFCKKATFSVQCGCQRYRGAMVWPLPEEPPVSAVEIDCAQKFRAFLLSLGRPEATSLAEAIAICIAGIEAQSEEMYSNGENMFVEVMENAPATLQAQIEEWFAANPDCVWQ